MCPRRTQNQHTHRHSLISRSHEETLHLWLSKMCPVKILIRVWSYELVHYQTHIMCNQWRLRSDCADAQSESSLVACLLKPPGYSKRGKNETVILVGCTGRSESLLSTHLQVRCWHFSLFIHTSITSIDQQWATDEKARDQSYRKQELRQVGHYTPMASNKMKHTNWLLYNSVLWI